MDNQDILDSNHHQPSNDGETYPISDHDSSIASNDLIDTNHHRQGDDEDEEELEFAQSLSQDSLVNGEEQTRREENPLAAAAAAAIPPLPVPTQNSMTHSRLSSRMSTMKSSTGRSLALDEHIKLVKQKKEEAEVLRLQRFQEQLKKKEQKWQQQQLERMKKWLQLRNRDTDHRTQVEERRRKREEEAKAKIDDMIRREKEREQRVTASQHPPLRTATPSHRPDSMMSMSTDILSTRRAISASRLRPTNHLDRRGMNNHSPVPAASSDAREETEAAQAVRPRGQINETFRRLAKPRSTPMTQSVYVGANAHTIPQSRSSHQLRIPTPPVIPPGRRQNGPTRPVTVPNSTTESRTSPSDEAASSATRPKPVASRPIRAPRSVMSTSHSSSSLSTIKTNVRRIGPVVAEPLNGSASPPPPPLLPAAPTTTTNTNTNGVVEDANVDDPVTTEEYQRKLNQKIREARQREEDLRRQAEQEEFEREQEQIRLVEEQRRAEQERLQRAIDERERENELKRQEELRLAQQREELERRQAEETERLQREREERAKREEEERIERKRRLDLIMRRTRQTSPNSKPELQKSNVDVQSNGHETPSPAAPLPPPPAPSAPAPAMTHSMSENRFPSSTSNENFLDTIASPSPVVTETPKFKSPLIQSLLNKARNTRSTDNLIQTSMTTSQIILDQSPLTLEKPSTPSPHRSDDDDDDDESNHLLTSSTTNNNNNPTPSYPADSVVH